ncbi:MAG TPA: hypothetical protein VNM38_08165 [Solirubrobacterales bacterium]|nr:hypothetical protein [Solirubrobacterales bacterium]
MIWRRLILSLSLCMVASFTLGAAYASAAVVWNLDIHHNETHLPSGGTGQYWLDVDNVGDAATQGLVTATLKLPNGIVGKGLSKSGSGIWTCPNIAGATTISCLTTKPIGRHVLNDDIVVVVDVAAGASGDRFARAEVSGGGAAKPATALELTQVGPDPAGFGIVEGSFKTDFYNRDGVTPVRKSGAHPDLAIFAFDFNTVSSPTPLKPEQKAASEPIRDLQVALPPGFLGNPTAVGECTPAELSFATCPRSSQVGRIDLRLIHFAGDETLSVSTGVFNMVHPRGSIADLAFTFTGIPVHINASLDPSKAYAITSSVSDINETLPPFHQKLTLWGVPADPIHDSERCHAGEELDTSSLCPTDTKARPFLTVPFQCESDNVTRLHHYDSWPHTGAFGPELEYRMPGRSVECDEPRFDPAVEVEPTGHQANTPTGLDVRIKVPQNENPNAPATPPVKRLTVSLPEGMSFSPSFADGLQSCGLAQMRLGTNEPIGCPDASRIGEVSLSSPLLPKPLEGSMYLAAQDDNPFGSLFALYLVLHDTEERGVLVKIPGRIDVDPVSGKIVTVFDETPQFPFDDLTLKFRSGPRAPLVSPPTCGEHRIGVEVTSWAQPDEVVDVSNAYKIGEGPNGTPCPPGNADKPFSPHFSAGTLNPTAGKYSPFVFRLDRDDSEQELRGVTAVLPDGLTAKLAGIPSCPDAVIASISTAAGAGRAEQANPACPAASQIGTVSAGLGAGPNPNYFPGRVFLAGPYKGAPLSLAIIAPGLAGPLDLGNVIVRTALRVDPTTAQVTAVSDPFPTILQGVILRVRDVRLRVDRPETTLNPTNCSPMAVKGLVSGTAGGLFSSSQPFQVGDCASLGFAPKLALRFSGGTKRGALPKLRATLKMPKGGANIAHASVALPHSIFLEQGHIATVCTRVQFAAEKCPARSIYGSAVAKTPLFSKPLEGPVYLRSSDNPLPDLVAKLRGPVLQPIEIDLVGRIDSVNQGLRTTFDTVPDAPVDSFTLNMLGGKRGLLVYSTNVCRSMQRATAKFKAQNGARKTLHPKLLTSCSKGAKGKRLSGGPGRH